MSEFSDRVHSNYTPRSRYHENVV